MRYIELTADFKCLWVLGIAKENVHDSVRYSQTAADLPGLKKQPCMLISVLEIAEQ